jgi:histidinol-phosphate/aromatic aminotransferase/cobyric acid decarboxylase-like protein
MKAIILTAGYARRMRPLTNSNHKTLLKIGDDTIIERIINGLCDNGINDVVIVTGYLKEKLTKFLLEKFPNVNFTFVHNEVYDQTNNIYSMALAFEQIEIDQDILLIESDLIYHSHIIKNLIDDPRENIALVDKYGQGMDGTVVSVEDGVITNVIPPHLQPPNFDFSDKFKTLNIYKFSQEFASTEFKKLLTYYAKVIDDNCYYELILGILIYMQRRKIFALTVEGDDWAEVDDPNDLDSALFVFEKDKQLGMLEHAFGGYWNYDITDFCFIRNMYFPSGSVLSELRNNMEHLLWNYGSRQTILNQKLAYYLLCDVQNVVVLNGAAQVYPMLKWFFQGKSGRIPSPTFGEYTRLFEQTHTFDDFGDLSTDLSQYCNAEDDVIVFVNPNNPSGTEIDTKSIYDLAKSNPQKWIVVDESFIEFSKYDSLLSILEESPLDNIIVIKSLSKSLGLPGIRLGYVYSTNREFISFVMDNTPVWNMNSMAEHFMEILLKHRNAIQKSFEDTIRDRESFANMLSASPLISRVLDSGGNFITCEMAISAKELESLQHDLLTQHKTFIKNATAKFSDDKAYIRLAVRTPPENARLVTLLDNK